MLEILGTIGFDWRVALANLVSFLIIFWLLKKYAFGPMARIIKERQSKIAEGLDNAGKAEEHLQQAQATAAVTITDAKKEANSIVASATDQGKNIIGEATAQAEIKAKGVLDAANKKIDADREAMQSEVEAHAAEVVVRGIEKILSEEFTGEQNVAFSQKAIAAIKK